MGEQEGEEESTVVAIVIGAKRNARSKEKSGVRIGSSFSFEAYVSQNNSSIKSNLTHESIWILYEAIANLLSAVIKT